MDRTQDFNRLLEQHGFTPPPLAAAADSKRPRGEFLAHAEEQRARLVELRRQVKAGEANTRAVRELQGKMGQLEALVTKGEQTEPTSRSVQPEPSRDLVAHRRGVVAALYEELSELAATVQKTQVKDLQMENEVATYFTAAPPPAYARRAAMPTPVPVAPAAVDSGGWLGWSGDAADGTGPSELELSEERMDAEAQSLLTALETDLDQIQGVQAKVQELAAMNTIIATKVQEQSEQIEHINEVAVENTELIEKAKDHLQQAVKNQDGYRFYVMCWFIGSALFLLVFDFIDAHFSWI